MSKSSSTTEAKTYEKPEKQAPITPVDCTQASKGVWLVKVPKYLANKWINAPDDDVEVGRIRITKNPQTPGSVKQDVVFQLNPSLLNTPNGQKADDQSIPLQHKFDMAPLGNQTIYILKQGEENQKEALSVIGHVKQRAECTPIRDDMNYIDLKRAAVKKQCEPKKTIIQLDAPVVKKFLPSVHPTHVAEKDKPKKQRKSKEEVQDVLFAAFAKHQFYNIRDLERITQQPMAYLKEILHDICCVNIKGVHKNTWQLKPEYRSKNDNESN